MVGSDSRGLVCSFSPGFRVRRFSSSSGFRDKLSSPLALMPDSGCVSFPVSGGIRLPRDCAGVTGPLNLLGAVSLSYILFILLRQGLIM